MPDGLLPAVLHLIAVFSLIELKSAIHRGLLTVPSAIGGNRSYALLRGWKIAEEVPRHLELGQGVKLQEHYGF